MVRYQTSKHIQDAVSFTWHDGDSLESPENPESSESGQVAELNEGSEVAWKKPSANDPGWVYNNNV